MKREIKYRGLTTKNGWVYGSLVVATTGIKSMPKQHTKTWIIESAFGNGGWFSVMKRSYVLPNTVGQFTGLLDLNGIEIYEGDYMLDGHFGTYGEVKFGDGKFYVLFEDEIQDLSEWTGEVVISNIHKK